MDRAAGHILSSPNPGQLEMKILVNHAADPRFAFLKGRWKRAWTQAKAANTKDAKPAKLETGESALAGLATYSDSDESAAQEEVEALQTYTHANEEQEKATRRERAREWSKRRREDKKGS